MLIPKDKLNAIKTILENDDATVHMPFEENTLANDPWKGLLGDDE